MENGTMNMTKNDTTTESLLDGGAYDDVGGGWMLLGLAQAMRDFSEETTGPAPHSQSS